MFPSIQFSRSVVSDSLWPHGLQHARPPCPSPTPGVYPKSCPLSQWCHPTFSPFVVPFSSYPQSFPASGSFQMSQLFTSGGQGIGVSASTSVLPMNTQNWSPLGWTGWILAVQGTVKSLLQYHSSKASILRPSDLVRWSGIPISFRIFQFIVIHTVKGFGIVNKAEIDVFLELSCFFNDPVDVGNLISGSSAFSKTSLNILKRSLVFPIILFSSISMHWSLRKSFLSLLAILWNSAFIWVYLSFSPLPFASLLFSAICNKILLYSIGSCIQYLVITYDGKESEKEFISTLTRTCI